MDDGERERERKSAALLQEPPGASPGHVRTQGGGGHGQGATGALRSLNAHAAYPPTPPPTRVGLTASLPRLMHNVLGKTRGTHIPPPSAMQCREDPDQALC